MISLALGIGANTAIFSLMDALILRQLPGVADPGRLVTLASGNSNAGELNIAVRSTSPAPTALVATVNAALARVDGSLGVEYRTLDGQVYESITQERLVAMLSGLFAALALLLAALGLYGVTAYAVARRRTEIGIRLALGAGPANILRLTLTRVSLLVGIGVAIGTAASLGLSRFVAALLYGLQPQDPATLAVAIAMLATVAAVAGGLPAWRAARTDPAAVLREP